MRWPENSDGLFAGLEALYRELDEELGPLALVCRACGECCNFDNFDFVLYASGIEANNILSKAAPLGSPCPGENICPFLSDGKCAIWGLRTLGCRTFFCTFGDSEKLHEIHNRYLKKLKDLSERFGLEWDYRPFLKFLTG